MRAIKHIASPAGGMNTALRPLAVACPLCGAGRFRPCIRLHPVNHTRETSNRPHKLRMQAADRARRFK